jgi:hypothetical protein
MKAISIVEYSFSLFMNKCYLFLHHKFKIVGMLKHVFIVREGQVRFACMCHEHNKEKYKCIYRLLQKSELIITLPLLELKLRASNRHAIFNDCI